MIDNLGALDALLCLEPHERYVERAATALVDLAGVSEVRVSLADAEGGLEHAGPGSSEDGFETIPMYHQASYLGEVHFRRSSGVLSKKKKALFRWLVQVLGRNLVYLQRLSRDALGPEEIGKLLEQQPLSRRERDVVAGLMHGMSTEDIARDMGVKGGSVNTYVKRACAKLGVHSRVALIAHVTGQKQSSGR